MSDLRDLQVYKSNELMSASYKLSVAENRVILTCIAKINRNPEAKVTDQIMYNVTAREFAELCGITMKVAYAELKQAVEALYDRKVVFSMSDRKRNTRLVQTADYLKNEGRIELRFGTDILPYLVAIQTSYTKYNLKAVVRLSTYNSVRLYELIVQSRFTGRSTVLLPLDVIRFAMGIPDDQYPAYADFRKRVIEQAIKEVNRASDIHVLSFRPKRDGKRIAAIELTYEERPNFGMDQVQEDLLLNDAETPPKPKAPAKSRAASKRTPAITEEEIIAQARPGESREQVIARIKAQWRVIEAEVA
jgi:plasmid replication initiation protein